MDPDDMRRLIVHKRDGEPLSAESWQRIVADYLAGALDEAQFAALLMACVLRDLNFAETLALTKAMVASGMTVGYSRRPVVDKHSSGGVGDTVSLLAVPIAAAAGARVAKLAGRALGHTGGTIDKLEALPGVRTDLSIENFIAQVEQIGCAIAAQSAHLVPADGRIYRLRDRTATIPSVGLIAASIVSKKIAAGADAIVYDIKIGRGAFMQTLAQGRVLAERIVAVTRAFGRHCSAVLTSMDEPLGSMIGDGLEALEALRILEGTASRTSRLARLAVEIADDMLALVGIQGSAEQMLQSGAAAARFRAMLTAQGGDMVAIGALQPAGPTMTLCAKDTGYVGVLDSYLLGEAAREIVHRHGPMAGIEILAPVGTKVSPGTPLLKCYGDVDLSRLNSLIAIVARPPAPASVILDRIEGE